jgi:hypothetical protein
MNILKQYPSRYFSIDDLDEMGGTLTSPIKKVVLEEMKNQAGQTEKKPVMYLQGHSQGFVINKSNAITLAEGLGPDTDGWAGKSVKIQVEAWGPAAQKKRWMACTPASVKERARRAQSPLPKNALDDLLDDDEVL